MWKQITLVAVKAATLTWFRTKRAAVAVAEAVLDSCSDVLKPVRSERRADVGAVPCIQSDVQNLETAGVMT